MKVELYCSNIRFSGPLFATLQCVGDGTPGTITFEPFVEEDFPGKDVEEWRSNYEDAKRMLPKLLAQNIYRREMSRLDAWSEEALRYLQTYGRFGNLGLEGFFDGEKPSWLE